MLTVWVVRLRWVVAEVVHAAKVRALLVRETLHVVLSTGSVGRGRGLLSLLVVFKLATGVPSAIRVVSLTVSYARHTIRANSPADRSR